MPYFADLRLHSGNWLSLGKVSKWLRTGKNYWVGHINPTQRLSLGKQSDSYDEAREIHLIMPKKFG